MYHAQHADTLSLHPYINYPYQDFHAECLFILRGCTKGITIMGGGGVWLFTSHSIRLNESTTGGDASVEAFSTYKAIKQ